MAESFAAADANGDGRHDADEWKVWIDGMRAKQAERGEFADVREGTRENWFAMASKVDPNQEGVAL